MNAPPPTLAAAARAARTRDAPAERDEPDTGPEQARGGELGARRAACVAPQCATDAIHAINQLVGQCSTAATRGPSNPGDEPGADAPHHDRRRRRRREQVGGHARQRHAAEHEHEDRGHARLRGNGDGERIGDGRAARECARANGGASNTMPAHAATDSWKPTVRTRNGSSRINSRDREREQSEPRRLAPERRGCHRQRRHDRRRATPTARTA